MSDKEKVCFVVMGFGKKTDYESGRKLDLDATYEAIIQPAVEANGFRCIRANEILHSGVIDLKMYEMLLRADLVVADISTGNVNAVYELGVRHALRPYSTIVMKEKLGKMHFDLDHTATFMYEHLGEDIGSREAKRAQKELGALIKAISADPKPDSPVYTYIPRLKEPSFTDDEFEEVLADAEEVQEKFSALLSDAEAAADNSDHAVAATKFIAALGMSSDNSYLRQQAALHTYKSKLPSEPLALMKAQSLLEPLEPERSNDPETLGLSGAIYKRLWDHNNDPATLDQAIRFYEKGFELRGDYYNGENAATCLEIRTSLQEDVDEAMYDQMSATKIRETIFKNLIEIAGSDNFDERSDQVWIFATLANCSIALGKIEEYEKYEKKFLALKPAKWQIETYNISKKLVTSHYKR
ncbi:TRAFs-binding domain-containing protein [Hoeflea sp. AS60]|uniref:TRAFs-binding domain-containing protein n=1 Tax=Hoeflea sp. AS60 TaxID=3135780 RepID=UPI00317B3D87